MVDLYESFPVSHGQFTMTCFFEITLLGNRYRTSTCSGEVMRNVRSELQFVTAEKTNVLRSLNLAIKKYKK